MQPLTPPKLGRYEIVDEIGKGAMGVVYLARDPLIGRLVALKTFRIGYSVKDNEMEQFRIRFMREAQSAGILSHANIVTIHDVVEQTSEGMAFIAMEYVRGTTLKAVLQSEQTLGLGYVVDIISQIAEALDYAHAHRVIHRDVKPANILITADNRVKITDFGIARLDTSNLTQEGQLLGTPNYMAPEQIQGKEVDHRADLFALGVVLYEMLTRHKPFQGENLTVVSHRIVYDHFTPPREYAGDMPPGLEPILDRSLDKDPARRYQRAKDMVEDLRRVLATGSRDDLNETLSISAWAPGMAPAAPPPGGFVGGAVGGAAGATVAGTGTAGATMASPHPPSPPLPATPALPASAPPAPKTAAKPVQPTPATPPKSPKPPKPPKPRGPKPPLSLKRISVLLGLGALLAILAVAGLRLGASRSGGPPVQVDSRAEAARSRYLGLLQDGATRMSQGDYAGAAATFAQAEQLAPDAKEKDRSRKLFENAQHKSMEYVQTLSRGEQISTYLMAAQTSLMGRRYADATAAADSVLAIDAGNAEAKRIKTESQAALTRQRQRPRNTPVPAPSQPIVAATPLPEVAPAPVQPAPVENQFSRLKISVRSALPEATVRLSMGGKTIFNRTFRGERSGILRKGKPFNASDSVQIKAGIHELGILVAPGGKAGRNDVLNGNFPADGTRTLEIQVNELGTVFFNLD